MPVIQRYESKLYIIKEIKKPKENRTNSNFFKFNVITNSLKSKVEELKNKKIEEKAIKKKEIKRKSKYK